MKVLLINGSPRREGNTYTALSEAARQLGKNRCAFDDDVTNSVIEKMEACDAIILGAPVYYGQPAAQSMALQQRMLYAGNAAFQGKPAAVVTVCRRGGASAAFQTLQMPFQMCNMPIVTSQYWNIAYGRTEGQSALDTEGMQTMRRLADNMSVMLKMYATGKAEKPEVEPWDPMHFIR